MCNPKITYEQYRTEQLTFFIEEPTALSADTRRSCQPTFQPYENRQGLAILNLHDLIPAHHE